jgi:FecR protein
MSQSSRLGRALRVWQTMGVPVEQSSQDAERERALKEAIRAVPERRRVARRRRIVVEVLLSAAAVLLVLSAFVLLRKPTSAAHAPARATLTMASGSAAALVLRGGDTRFVDARARFDLEAGDDISLPEGGSAQLVLPSGARVEVGASTRLAVPGLGGDDVVRLAKGRVALQVPKLRSPHTLSVVTPDARVVVHGTRFSVTVSGEAPSTVTSVAVEEGEVAVLSARVHRVLRAGQSWRSDEVAAETPLVPEPDAATAASAVPAVTASGKRVPAPISPSARDDLAEQNRAYRAALAAKNRGDDQRAADLLGELLARHPDSPLATEAARERARALDRLAKTKAEGH